MTTNSMPTFDAAEMRAAGLTPQVLGRLIGISRVTASYWLNGHRQPHPLLRRKVVLLLDGVRREVQIGSLPPPVALPVKKQGQLVEAALAKYFQ
jgi:hypothetical protein